MEAFRPDRWLDENGELRSIPEFIPFGLGMISLKLHTKSHSYGLLFEAKMFSTSEEIKYTSMVICPSNCKFRL